MAGGGGGWGVWGAFGPFIKYSFLLCCVHQRPSRPNGYSHPSLPYILSLSSKCAINFTKCEESRVHPSLKTLLSLAGGGEGWYTSALPSMLQSLLLSGWGWF